jgi:hypothetical protein
VGVGAIGIAGQTVDAAFDNDINVGIDSPGFVDVSGQTITAAIVGNINASLDAGAITVAGQTVAESITVEVPDVVGDAQAVGTATLEGVGFVVSSTSSYDAVVPAGDIISQNPTAGSFASPGSTVDIVVSIGPLASGGVRSAHRLGHRLKIA